MSGLVSESGNQAVFFDAVGTLLFPEPPPVEVYTETGRRHGSDLSREQVAERFHRAFRREEEKDAAVGLAVDPARERQRWSAIVRSVFHGTGAADASDEVFAELWDYFAQSRAWHVAPDAPAVLSKFSQRGYVLGIASNFDSRLHRLLDSLPELTPIAKRVLSSEVGWRKPDRRFFEAVMRSAGCPPRQILFVGDDPVSDYDAAKSAGLHAVLFDREGQVSAARRRVRRLRDLLGLHIGA